MNRSHAFPRAVAVFEGGGVRGVAFGGAISEAMRSGITFTGAVGASAGSIAAVLVAAGFNPDAIADILKNDFSGLLSPGKPNVAAYPGYATAMAAMVPGSFGAALRRVLMLGQYSSERIETWIDDHLSKHLNIRGRKVIFADMPKPAAVIAADIAGSSVKVWSTSRTPTAAVGQAVRASCTIPFFFQPVFEGASVLVDGGLIANLPLFLAKDIQLEKGSPVLCFRLVSSQGEAKEVPLNCLSYIQSLIETVLDGVTEVQLSFSSRRQVIDIDTGNVRATDFELSEEKKLWLQKQGERAVCDFVVNEQTRVAESTPATPPSWQYRDELLTETARLIAGAQKDIAILAGDLSWLKELHVSLIAARLRKVSIRIICERQDSKEFKKAVCSALAIGAGVMQTERSYMAGTIIDGGTSNARMIAIESQPTMHGRAYQTPEDGNIITLVRDYHARRWNDDLAESIFTAPNIISMSEQEVCNSLSYGVQQYKGLRIYWDTIDISKTRPLTKYFEELKLRRLRDLESIHALTGIRSGCIIKGSGWMITPPVVEKLKNDELVIIDGAHRLFANMSQGSLQHRVVLVENPHSNLPALPEKSWDSIIILPRRLDISDRYENFQPKEFRRLAAAYDAYFSHGENV